MKQLVISTKLTNRETASFNQYLKDISEIDVFTPEEEVICTEKASRGDKEAINELVRRNLRFVVSVAKQYATTQNHLGDLVNEGNIGLMIAVEKFKPEMGFKFISYAVWWIRKTIMEYISKHGRLVRLPDNKINSLSKLDKQINQLEQKLGRNVSIHEVIDEYGAELGLNDILDYSDETESSKKAAKKANDKVNNEFYSLDVLKSYSMDSLDRELVNDAHGDGSGTVLSDTMADNTFFKSADTMMMDKDTKKQLNAVLNVLKPRDKEIMIALYGLDGSLPRTLNDVGEDYGITREMIRQIKAKCLNKIKKVLLNTDINE